MGNAPVDPGERRSLERPADRDPLLFQLQRNRDGDKSERGACHERQPAQIALSLRLEAQQRSQYEREHRSLDHGDGPNHPVELARYERPARAEESHRTREDRREVRIAALAHAAADDERIYGKHCVECGRQRQQPRPHDRQIGPGLPLEDRQPRGDDGTDGDKRPSMERGQRQEHAHVDDMRQEQHRECGHRATVDRTDERQLSDEECGTCGPRDLLARPKAAGQRLPQERVTTDGGRRQHCRQSPLGCASARAPCRHDGRGRDRTGCVHGRDAAPEGGGARRERHRGQGREHGPWRQRPRAIRREQQQEEMADEPEVESARKRRLNRRAIAVHAAQRPRVAGERDERQPDDDEERRQDADAAGGLRPPGHHQEPRQDAADLRDGRQASGGALDEEGGVRDGEEQRQRPERRGRHRSERQEEQKGQPEEQHDAAAPRWPERT